MANKYHPYWEKHSINKHHWTTTQARYIFNRDGGICIFCGRPASEIHHVLPVRNGGKAVTSNGVCACHACNMYIVAHPSDITLFARAIFWLEQHGEDTNWIDDLWERGEPEGYH